METGKVSAAILNPVVEMLTPRKREILELTAQGMDNRTIGRELGISEHTIKRHIREAAIRMGIRRGAGSLRIRLSSSLRLAQGRFCPPAVTNLSLREGKILAGIADGQSNREIGLELGFSEGVIKNHNRTLFDKIGMDTRAEAAAWYYAHFTTKAQLDSNTNAR